MTEYGPGERALAEWSLRGSGAPSIETVECLARMHLELRRGGGRLTLSDVCDELSDLLDLVGLADLTCQAHGTL